MPNGITIRPEPILEKGVVLQRMPWCDIWGVALMPGVNELYLTVGWSRTANYSSDSVEFSIRVSRVIDGLPDAVMDRRVTLFRDVIAREYYYSLPPAPSSYNDLYWRVLLDVDNEVKELYEGNTITVRKESFTIVPPENQL